MSTNKQGLGKEVYSGAASFGVITTSFRAILGTIVGILIFILGVYLVRYRSRMKSITGKVLESSLCDKISDNLVCTSPVEYEIEGTKYTHNLTTNSNKYKKGDDIKLWYVPSKPEIPQYSPISLWFGFMIIGLAILLILGSWFMVWLARKNKFYAAIAGVGDGINVVGAFV